MDEANNQLTVQADTEGSDPLTASGCLSSPTRCQQTVAPSPNARAGVHSRQLPLATSSRADTRLV